jgi:acyl carrier protein
MKEKVKNILLDVRPELDFDTEQYLVSDGIFESVDIITLVAELEDEFSISIEPDLMVADNFDSLDKITNMVAKLVSDTQ